MLIKLQEALLSELRNKIINKISKLNDANTAGVKLYISRSGAARRRIGNESDVR